LQEQASNHLKLLWSKAMVVSVEEKSWHETVAGVDQGDERERTADEVSKIVGQHQNRWLAELRDKSRGNLFTAWAVLGIKAA
jgi:hypothetical protein